MNPRQHARLARALIDRCGGIDEAAAACRVNRSSLSAYQTVDSGHFMPADVLADLEAYCGDPIYSRALFEARPSAPLVRDLVDETCEAVETVVEFQKAVRLATRDGALTQRERAEVAAIGAKAEEQLHEALEAIDAAQAPRRIRVTP